LHRKHAKICKSWYENEDDYTICPTFFSYYLVKNGEKYCNNSPPHTHTQVVTTISTYLPIYTEKKSSLRKNNEFNL
jgi:hypothetical protein